MWLLRLELRTSGRAASALSLGAISPISWTTSFPFSSFSLLFYICLLCVCVCVYVCVYVCVCVCVYVYVYMYVYVYVYVYVYMYVYVFCFMEKSFHLSKHQKYLNFLNNQV